MDGQDDRQEYSREPTIDDEIIVDLMQKACEVTYHDTIDQVKYHTVSDVSMPYLKPDFLLKTKMTVRPKDAENRLFLEQLRDSEQAELQHPLSSEKPSFFSSSHQKNCRRLAKNSKLIFSGSLSNRRADSAIFA